MSDWMNVENGSSQAPQSISNASQGESDKDSQTPTLTPAQFSKGPPPSTKTISCVSCRKRKLKCDKVKPTCGTCTRLRHECEFPERKKNLGSNRRSMKQLEARLAQVETQLGSESNTSTNIEGLSAFNEQPGWNDDMNMNMGSNVDLGNNNALNDSFDTPDLYDLPKDPLNPTGDFFSQELLALGLHEPLPAQEAIDELTNLYFESSHRTLPIIHRYRYYASLDRAPHMRPPAGLRYMMWTLGATVSVKYRAFEGILYERARRYLHEDEMKGHGEHFVSIYYVQAWALASSYEAVKTYFPRSWMSSGRCIRLASMLNLQYVDGDDGNPMRIPRPTRDWIELEEQRRAFWAAFYVDRWASLGTGWPMQIFESEIMTNLPCSEEAFQNGIVQSGITLAEALKPEGAAKLHSFSATILSAAFVGHNFQHSHKKGPDERPGDFTNGEFWKRHRKMDNVLANTFMFLPDHLRMGAIVHDPSVALIHMEIHASVVCLHQAAILTAEKHSLNAMVKSQSRARSMMAAEEIVNIMRLITHYEAVHLNPWTSFCLFLAAGVLLQDKKLDPSRVQSLNNLEFALSAMRALGTRRSIAKHFTAQLELEIEASGILNSVPSIQEISITQTPITGVFPGRNVQDMTVDEVDPDVFFATTTMGPHYKTTPPLTVLPTRNRDLSRPADSTLWNWELSSSGSVGAGPSHIRNMQATGTSESSSTSTSYQAQAIATESTPSSDSSTPNSAQYPTRPNHSGATTQSGLHEWEEPCATDTAYFPTPKYDPLQQPSVEVFEASTALSSFVRVHMQKLRESG